MKRPKKVLSLILAVLMVFGMMPAGVANAAETPKAQISMVLGQMGKMDVVVGMDDEYNELREERQLVNNDMYQNNLEAQSGYQGSPNASGRVANAAKAATYFTPLASGAEVKPGDVVWLSVSVNIDELKAEENGVKGLYNGGVLIEFDSTKLELLEGKNSPVTTQNPEKYTTVANATMTGKIAPVATAKNIPTLHYLAGNFGLTTSEKTSTVVGEEGLGTRSFAYTTFTTQDSSSAMGYLPTNSVWLYAVPFKVKTAANGSFEFSYVTDQLTDGSIVGSMNCTKAAYGVAQPGSDNELNIKTQISSTPLSQTITAPAVAPNLAVTYANGIPTFTATTTGGEPNFAGISVKIGDAPVVACSATNGTVAGDKSTWIPNDATLNAIAKALEANKSIVFSHSTDAAKTQTFTKGDGTGNTIKIADKIATPVTIDYDAETADINVGVKYVLDTAEKEYTAITTAGTTSVALTPGATAKKISYFVAGDGTKMHSSITATTVAARPAAPAPVLSADADKLNAAKKEGATLLTGVGTATKYLVTTSAPADAKAMLADGSAKTLPAAADGAYKIPDSRKTAGNKIYFAKDYVANSAFRSDLGSIDAAGNNFGTVSVTAPAKDAPSISVAIVGDKFTSSNAADYKVTAAADKGTNLVTAATPSGDGLTATLTVSAIAAGDYEITIGTNAVSAGLDAPKFANGTNKDTFTVQDKGYKLNVTSGGYVLSQTTYPGTNDATETPIQVTNLNAYDKLKDVKITSSTPAVTPLPTIKLKAGTTDTFTINGKVPTGSVTLDLDIQTEPNPITLSKSDITATATKQYDSKTDATANLTATNVYAGKDPGILGDYEYKTAAGGTTILVVKNLQFTDNDYYKKGTDLQGASLEFTVAGITLATITGLVGSPVTTKNNTAAAIVDALKSSIITANGFMNAEGKLVDSVLANADTELEALANETVIGAGYYKKSEVAVDLSTAEDSTALSFSATAKKGNILALTLPEGYDTVALTTASGYTLTGNKITTDLTAATATLTLNITDSTGTNTAINNVQLAVTLSDAEADYDAANNQSINVTIPASLINSNASDALKANFSDTGSTTQTIAINVVVKKQTTPPAPSGGFNVGFNAKDFGTSSLTSLEVGEDGKITALPSVSDVVKGATFLGWSTDGTKTGIIDPKTYVVKGDITLTAVYQGYMAGNGGGKVEPERSVTRAELLRMVLVAAGMYDESKDYGDSKFTDVKSGVWYENYISCAEQSGKDIIAGYTDGTFKPEQKVTREEAARIIAETFGVKVTEGSTTDKVNDFDKVHDWAKKYVAALCDNGTINGFEDGSFRANAAIQRDAASVMTNNYLGLDADKKDDIKADDTVKSPFTDMANKNHWAYADVMFASLSAPASYYSTEIVMPTGK